MIMRGVQLCGLMTLAIVLAAAPVARAQTTVLAPVQQNNDFQDATVLYGLGNWHLYHGRAASARKVFEQIVALPQWGAFGYLAAEAELARGRRGGRIGG